MNNLQDYDNPLTRFKKELWSLCLSMNVFDHIPNEKVEQAKEIFENIVSNYQAQILQQENDNMLKQTLLTTLKGELESLKQISRNSIEENKKNQFDLKLEEKQNEFNQMMKKETPPLPKFGDEQTDEPIDSENLDAMIQKQMAEMENVMTIQESENKIIDSPSFISSPMNDQQSSQSLERIETQIQQLNQNIKLQSSILQQIIQSQIAILNKIK